MDVAFFVNLCFDMTLVTCLSNQSLDSAVRKGGFFRGRFAGFKTEVSVRVQGFSYSGQMSLANCLWVTIRLGPFVNHFQHIPSQSRLVTTDKNLYGSRVGCPLWWICRSVKRRHAGHSLRSGILVTSRQPLSWVHSPVCRFNRRVTSSPIVNLPLVTAHSNRIGKSYWQIVLAIVLTERNAECDEEILDAISDGEAPGEIRQPELVTDWRGSSDLPRVEFVFDFVREHVNILNK